jgi:hypothetical protein
MIGYSDEIRILRYNIRTFILPNFISRNEIEYYTGKEAVTNIKAIEHADKMLLLIRTAR